MHCADDTRSAFRKGRSDDRATPMGPETRAGRVSRPNDRLTCSETILRLDDYVDRSLTFAELRQVESHLDDCVHCASRFAFEVSLVAGIRERLHRIAAPPHLLESVRRRLAAESADG